MRRMPDVHQRKSIPAVVAHDIKEAQYKLILFELSYLKLMQIETYYQLNRRNL